MAIKPALTLKIGQHLTMTPQLQQAIRLLQLSTVELEQEIQEALETNLMLEEATEEGASEGSGAEQTSLDAAEQTIDTPTESDAPVANATDGADTVEPLTGTETTQVDNTPPDPEIDGDVILDTSQEIASDSLAEDLPVDSVWEDTWDESPLPPSYTATEDDGGDYIDTRNSEAVSIASHLLEQVNLLSLTETDLAIALSIVDGLDTEGMLTVTVPDLLSGLPPEMDVEEDEVLAVLNLIQHLDPVGIAARDLRECLLIQLRDMPPETPWRAQAINIVEHYLDQLGNHDYALLQRKTRLKEPQLKEAIDLILQVNPRPGAAIAPSHTEYVEPDVIVRKANDRWTVELNPKSAPRIRVNSTYAGMVRRGDNSSDNTQLRDHLQEARWFIKSLQQRNDTLLRVSTKIVDFQRGFFEYGEHAMRPLVLHDIAEAVELHESTISRVTTHKYMHTPAGVFELKYFFSSHVSTHTGGEVSSTAIRAHIKRLVAEENPRKPLSDSKIAALLADEDIKVARRTIAKYRESLNIPPSNERKQLV